MYELTQRKIDNQSKKRKEPTFDKRLDWRKDLRKKLALSSDVAPLCAIDLNLLVRPNVWRKSGFSRFYSSQGRFT